MQAQQLQIFRRYTQSAFFILFCVAPLFNLFRYDLDEGHFYLLSFHWSIGIGKDLAVGELAKNLLLYGLIPIVFFLALGLFIFYKFGRIYCGWLCPHFSVVEMINQNLSKAIGKLSLWDKKELPAVQVNGEIRTKNTAWWFVVVPLSIAMAFLWSVVLMGYIINPYSVFSQLWENSLSFSKQMFLLVATFILTFEFLFARHLFCRFGCAFGLFQSLAWMANRKALVINFEKEKSVQCKSCDNYCDHACPMRLKPRGMKRHMFSCTQCAQCVSACNIAQQGKPVLSWKPNNQPDNNAVAIPITMMVNNKTVKIGKEKTNRILRKNS